MNNLLIEIFIFYVKILFTGFFNIYVFVLNNIIAFQKKQKIIKSYIEQKKMKKNPPWVEFDGRSVRLADWYIETKEFKESIEYTAFCIHNDIDCCKCNLCEKVVNNLEYYFYKYDKMGQ